MSEQTTTRRDNGAGYIYQRGKSWAGRVCVGLDAFGKKKYHYFSGKSPAEVKKKIKEYNNQGANAAEVSKMPVGEYVNKWLTLYKKDSLKRSSYDRLEKTVNHQIIPNLGMVQMGSLGSDDVQAMLKTLKSQGKSYSTIKKAYDCMNMVCTHAFVNRDIPMNFMPLVKMPNKAQFEQKEISYFTPNQARAIIEEVSRKYSNGTPVYPYGDAYILLLYTGMRSGELIGLEKSDWDAKAGNLTIRRTVAFVKKRDENGTTGGYEMITNPTKTYSSTRTIHLNETAKAALERLYAQHPNAANIVCNSKGKMLPPANLDRSFYRALKNIGLPQSGVHSLRHTFASFLFASGADVKTVSTILGHTSIQITLDTYTHLINNPDRTAMLNLDDYI